VACREITRKENQDIRCLNCTAGIGRVFSSSISKFLAYRSEQIARGKKEAQMITEYVDARAYFKFELSEARKALKKAVRDYCRAVAETKRDIKK
jgi:hypothetical protein